MIDWKEITKLAIELAYEAHPYPKDFQYRGDEYKRNEVINDVFDQILAAFKAHIASYPKPRFFEVDRRDTALSRVYRSGQLQGVEADRKALMESLE